MKKKSITSDEFDSLFDDEKDITEFLDMNTAKRSDLETNSTLNKRSTYANVNNRIKK